MLQMPALFSVFGTVIKPEFMPGHGCDGTAVCVLKLVYCGTLSAGGLLALVLKGAEGLLLPAVTGIMAWLVGQAAWVAGST